MAHYSSVRVEQLERHLSSNDDCLRRERAYLAATEKEIVRKERRLFLSEFDFI